MATNDIGLSKILAKLTAESGQYNVEKGIAADVFSATYNSYIENSVRPAAFVFAFDTADDASGFYNGIYQDLSEGTKATLQVAQRHASADHNMVLVIGSPGEGSDLIGTRLEALAASYDGRLVYTFARYADFGDNAAPPGQQRKPKDFG